MTEAELLGFSAATPPSPEPVLRIVVRGQPKPQGSKKPFINKHTGKPGLMESSGDALAYWRRAVTEAARAAMKDAYQARLSQPVRRASQFPLDGPVQLAVLFSFRRPKNHYGTGKNAATLKEHCRPDALQSRPGRPLAPHPRRRGLADRRRDLGRRLTGRQLRAADRQGVVRRAGFARRARRSGHHPTNRQYKGGDTTMSEPENEAEQVAADQDHAAEASQDEHEAEAEDGHGED